MKIKTETIKNIASSIQPLLLSLFIDIEANRIFFINNRVVFYNGKQIILLSFPSQMELATPAKYFIEAVKSIDSEEVILKDSKSKLKIIHNSGDIEYKIALSKVPISDAMKRNISSTIDREVKWKKAEKEFMSGLILCATSTAFKALQKKEYLEGVYVDKKYIISADNSRISVYKHGSKFDSTLFVEKEALAVLSIYDDISKYSVSGELMHFKSKNKLYITTTRKIDFPKSKILELVNEKEDEVKISVDNAKLKEVIHRASVFLSNVPVKDKTISVKIGKNEIEVKAKTIDKGMYSGKVKVENKIKKDIELKVNPIFLLEAFKYSTNFFLSKRYLRITAMDEKFQQLIVLKS